MRSSLARRVSRRRPSGEELEARRLEIAEAERTAPDSRRLDELRIRLGLLERRMREIPYLAPLDIRFNRYKAVPKPITQAVMFRLLYVSGSIAEAMKYLAQRVVMLLFLVIRRHTRMSAVREHVGL